MGDKRACFDFEIDFSNGGGIQGQGFRLDIAGEDIDDDELAAHIIQDMRLLMVGEVRILNKRIVTEPHKRRASTPAVDRAAASGRAAIDLSHEITDGMVTYPGLPGPVICDHLSRAVSRSSYAEGTEFQIGRIEMVANTGTYVDVPFHRYGDGEDLAAVALDRLANIPGVVVSVAGMTGPAIDWHHFAPIDCRGRAVLVHTGWDERWGTDDYFSGHPYLTEQAAVHLRDRGAALVGIDSLNIDSTDTGTRPVHTVLLAAGIPIVEHLCNLAAVPTDGFDFTAAPPKVENMGTFPVRAHAIPRPNSAAAHR